MNDSPISKDEMIQLFGKSIPSDAVELINNAHPDTTIGAIRNELRQLAAEKQRKSWTGVFAAESCIAAFKFQDQAEKWASTPGSYRGRANFRPVEPPNTE